MASSSWNSGSSEGELHQVMDDRKRKRMVSNRESARRSRMRKQKHLDDQIAQITQLRVENQQIVQIISLITQQFSNVESENSVLRAQKGELTQRLESLNEIQNYMHTLNGVSSLDEESLGLVGNFEGYNWNFTMDFLNNRQITTSVDIL